MSHTKPNDRCRIKPRRRLARVADIIERVDLRCAAADGPVTATLDEMTQDEISRIYALAKGKPENWKPKCRPI